MTLELEGDILLERAHSRRWVSIIAVFIPVAASVLLAAWFIRVYVDPPTVAIPSPVMIADAPPPPAALPKRAMVEAPPPPIPMPEPAKTPEPERTQTASALPMFATLSAAPPSLATAPPAYADPVQDMPSADVPSIIVAEPAEIEPSEPIAGLVPLPRAKPHGPVAALTGAVPLPRPRPTEIAPEADIPAVDRHSIN
jgi:hypothetical protein